MRQEYNGIRFQSYLKEDHLFKEDKYQKITDFSTEDIEQLRPFMTEIKTGDLEGKRVVCSGVTDGQLEYINRCAGSVTSSISGATDYLIISLERYKDASKTITALYNLRHGGKIKIVDVACLFSGDVTKSNTNTDALNN